MALQPHSFHYSQWPGYPSFDTIARLLQTGVPTTHSPAPTHTGLPWTIPAVWVYGFGYLYLEIMLSTLSYSEAVSKSRDCDPP